MADPVTIGTVAATLWPEFLAAGAIAPEVVGGTLAAMAPEALAVGGATAAGLATAPTIAEAMSPLAMEAGGGATEAVMSPLATEMYGGAANPFAGAAPGKDRIAAMIDKYGPKAATMLANNMEEPAPKPQSGGPRMGGQQAQAQPVTVDYGGAAQRKPAGGAAMLGIDDAELKRLLMSLRGY
jgi:hypothetical protein